MKVSFKKIFFICGLFSLCFIDNACAQGMGMGTPCGGPFPPCPVPLDGGISLLLAAGAAYGGKKIYDSLKKTPE